MNACAYIYMISETRDEDLEKKAERQQHFESVFIWTGNMLPHELPEEGGTSNFETKNSHVVQQKR